MKTYLSVILAAVALAGAMPAMAQTTNIILQTDYDGDAGEGNFNDAYGYCVAGSSAGTVGANSTGGVISGAGVGGTFANSITPNYTFLPSDPNWTNPALSYVYALVGNGTAFSGPISPITPTSVTGSLILSADIQVLGLMPGLTNTDVTVSKVQFMDGGGNILFDFTGDAGLVGSNFVHISVPLSSLGYASDAIDPISDFTNAAVVGSVASFTVEFTVAGLVGTIGGTSLISPPFGFTDGGALTVDNIELIQTGNTVPSPQQEQFIAQANFDTTFPSSDYGFNFRDGANAATGFVTTNTGGGLGGSNSLEYTVDLSSWAANPPAEYSGFGVGTVFTPLPFGLTSSNKASYRIYVSAKAGGLASGAATNISTVMDLLFYVPAGTESPVNASPAVVLDLAPALTLTTNWQSFVFDGSACPVGVNNGGSQALFNQYVSRVSQLQVQVATQGSPDIGAQFGYGTDTTIDIDSIKVVQLLSAAPPLTIVQSNNQLQVVWTDPATGGISQLQSSTNLAGPYLNVPGAASGADSPYTIPAGSKQQFFRTVWIP
ncbi:MAG TPA: hypothetical protein VGN61_16625 [Verrucomicrobiae bacterium]